DEAVAGLRDQDAARHPNDPAGLPQDDLDLAGVLAELVGEVVRQRRRLDLAQVDQPPLGLGDDLVGHDQDVAIAQAEAARVDRGPDQGGQVGARLDLRDAVEPVDADAAGHAHGPDPSTTPPAFRRTWKSPLTRAPADFRAARSAPRRRRAPAR